MKKSMFFLAAAALLSFNAQAAVNVLIPHEGMPITKDQNMCVMCHAADYSKAGAAKQAGQATTMPANHWEKGSDGKMIPAAQRWNCATCHSPEKNN